MFKWLAPELIDKGTTQKTVRSVVTGSTAELLFKMEGTSVASGSRVKGFLLPDPPEDAVVKALVKVGYTAEAAKSIVDACGPRLRPLEDQLQLHQKLPAKEVIKEQVNNATRQFESFFEMVGELEDDGRSTAAAVRILDRCPPPPCPHLQAHPAHWRDQAGQRGHHHPHQVQP